jgi:RNA ligase (TIGR02306 family)
MSECITKVEVIKSIEPHANADRLEIAEVRGWYCVVPKGIYKAGDLCVYIPIDSVMPETLLETLFTGASISPPKRVKTIKLRGVYSQGLVANIDTIGQYLGNHGHHIVLSEGVEITDELRITKYEPKLPGFQSFNSGSKARVSNPNFYKYKGIENHKNYVGLFQPDDLILASEKIHGTNFRSGWALKEPATGFFGKIKSLFTSKYNFFVGSHNVQLSEDGNNVYSNMARKLDLKNKLRKGEILYGEVYGPNIQKGYHYGKPDGEQGFVAFDIRISGGDWLSVTDFYERLSHMEIPVAPVLFQGEYKDLNIDEMVLGNSILDPSQKVMEGIVIKSANEERSIITKNGRRVLKCLSPEYLTGKNNTDFH